MKRADSYLKKYCRDFLKEAKELDPVSGRDHEITTIAELLCRKTKSNVMLIGEPGVGKTALVEGLAQRILTGEVPTTLKGVRMYALDIGELLSGTKYRGEFEKKFQEIITEVQQAKGNVVLFIDEIHIALGAGRVEDSNLDVANLLKPYLARGDSRLIGATTNEEYLKYVSRDAAFARRFQQFIVEEPSIPDTINILRGLKNRYQMHYDVRIRDAALVAAVHLSNRYLTARYQPDKAIDVLDEACMKTRMQLESPPEEIVGLEREIACLEMESTGIEHETDSASRARIIEIRKQLVDMRGKLETQRGRHKEAKENFENIVLTRKSISDRISDLEKTESDNLGIVMQLREEIKKVEDALKKDEETLTLTDTNTAKHKELHENILFARKYRVDRITNLEKVERDNLHTTMELRQQIQKADALKEDEKCLTLTDTVGPEQIANVVSRQTGIPLASIGTDEKRRLMGLAESLHKKVVGQAHAVTAVVEAVLRSRAGFGRANQPIGSFLFLGPTGVGKTELARALAKELFGDEKFIVRLDMSEYTEAQSVTRLIGSAPGYNVHSFQGGDLTEPVRLRPYSVVLLDEIEKAGKVVLNLLLQLLDEGRLTNSQGRKVDFTSTVVILTSNLGAEHLVDTLSGKTTTDDAHSLVIKSVKGHFKPELVNRFDKIVIFDPLSRDQMRKIVRLLLTSVVIRVATSHGIGLQITEGAVDYILSKAFNPVDGARPVRNWIENNVVAQLSMMVIREEIAKGSCVLLIHDHSKGEKLDYIVHKEEEMEMERETSG